MKVEVTLLGSLSLIVPMASVDLNQHPKNKKLSVSELKSGVKVEVAVQGFPSLIVLMVSVNVKQH